MSMQSPDTAPANIFYFKTSSGPYHPGMEVYVTRDFVMAGPNRAEIMGAVVRIDTLEDSGFGVAIHFLPAKRAQRLEKCASVPFLTLRYNA